MPRTLNDKWKPVRVLDVFYKDRKVGTLAEMDDHRVAFEYDPAWLQSGFSISPLSLPLKPGLFVPKRENGFDGLFGVFHDSMPDGWGALVVDRWLRSRGINPLEVSPLTRLAIVGSSGPGALTYKPAVRMETDETDLALDELAQQCLKLFESSGPVTAENMDEIFLRGGSSSGARPKANITLDGEQWIVKFPCSLDPADIGKQEYDYAQCAGRCGIIMPETRLLPSKKYEGFFAAKRFDRNRDEKIHMVSVSGLLETSHRIPNLDYEILLKLTMILTENFVEAEKMFRLMCFNVFAHNRDDHSRNFSFLYMEEQKKWIVSPAYDLTYSSSFGGEHATTVHGEGKNPTEEDLLSCAVAVGIDRKKAKKIIKDIRKQVNKDLGKYLKH